MDISELLKQNLSPELLAQIAGQAGITDPDQGVHASKSVIQTILQGISNNTSQESGANSFLSALDRDHDGSILNDVMGLLSGQSQASNSNMLNGAGILNHILGNKQQAVGNNVGQALGIDMSKIMPLMTMLAPIVMGILGKARANNQINTGNLQNVLAGATAHHVEQNPAYGMFGKLLDQDGDGQILDDIANLGMKFFLKK